MFVSLSLPKLFYLAVFLIAGTVQAEYQFALSNYVITPEVNYRYVFSLPTEDKFLVTVDYYSNALETVSYESLAAMPAQLSYNGQPLPSFTPSTTIGYPTNNPEFLYQIGVNSSNSYFLLKIATSSLAVVSAIQLSNVYPTYSMACSPDGSVLYLYGEFEYDHNNQGSALFVVSTSPQLQITQSKDMTDIVFPSFGISVSSINIYLVVYNVIYALDRATLSVQQTVTLPNGMNSQGGPFQVDEANEFIYMGTAEDSGDLIYTETFQLTKLSLSTLAVVSSISTIPAMNGVTYGIGFSDFLLVDPIKGVVYYGCESQGLFYGTSEQYKSPPLLVAVDIASWSVLGQTVLPGAPVGYVTGSQTYGAFSNSSMDEILLAFGALLARISIDSVDDCPQPTFTQSIRSQNGVNGTFTVTISNPSTNQVITDLRFSACNQSISNADIPANPAYDGTCGVSSTNGHYYSLGGSTSIEPQSTTTFTYQSGSTSPVLFQIEYVKCAPITPTAPTAAPSSPSDCPISITQELQSSWTQDSSPYATYTVIFTNDGTTTISSLHITLGDGVSSMWGLTANSDGTYDLPSYAALQPGASYSWGYIRIGASTASIVVSCANSATPSSAPSSAPISSPSTAPTAAPSSPTGFYSVSVTSTVVNSWTSGTQTCQQVNVHVTNTSPLQTLTFLQLTPSSDFTNAQSWYITVSGAYLTFPSSLTSLAPSASFDWGYVNCGSVFTFAVSNAY